MEQANIRRALLLAWFTIAWNLVEATASIAFGVGDRSISLFGFGVDSLIEVGSGALVIWRFYGESSGTDFSVARERKATLGIGVLFIALGLGTAIGSVGALWRRGSPTTTVPGMAISIACLAAMLWLWRAKTRVARRLDSATVMKDAACSLACAKLAAVLLVGSALFRISPRFWWSDAAAAAVLAAFFLREGWETVEASRKTEFSGGCNCANK